MTKTKVTGNPRGRPSKFDLRRATAVIARMMEGQGLAPAARAEKVAPSTFRNWVRDQGEELRADFEKAQAIRALIMQDEIYSIIEAGRRGAASEIKYREAFIAMWLPWHLQPRAPK